MAKLGLDQASRTGGPLSPFARVGFENLTNPALSRPLWHKVQWCSGQDQRFAFYALLKGRRESYPPCAPTKERREGKATTKSSNFPFWQFPLTCAKFCILTIDF